MANYIEVADFIAKDLEHSIADVLKNDTVLHKYFEFISYCSQLYFEQVHSELDTLFNKLMFKIVAKPYRFSDESRINQISAGADRVFCIEQITKENYLFIAGCEQLVENEDIENYVFAFNCDFYGLQGLKSISMFYLTLCEALSIFRKNNVEVASTAEFTNLNSWVRQHSAKLSKQYFMAQDVSKYFTTFDVFSRFQDFNLRPNLSWKLETVYSYEFPEGITVVADKYTFTTLKETVFRPAGVAAANIYTSRCRDIDHWCDKSGENSGLTLLRQPSINEDSFRDMVEDVRKFILDEIQH